MFIHYLTSLLKFMQTLLLTDDGSHTLLNPELQVTYHSKFGALQEAFTVYVNAGLRFLMQKLVGESPQLSILEIGFGSGLNAFMSYLQTLSQPEITLKYTGVEGFPLDMDTVNQLNYPQTLQAEEFAQAFIDMHQLPENEWHNISPNFVFRKIVTDFMALDLGSQRFDLIFFDAFAPTAQPELWNEAMMRRMFDLLRPNGVLTTYCAKGDFKRLLSHIGFIVEALPGPKGKREMTRAIKPFR